MRIVSHTAIHPKGASFFKAILVLLIISFLSVLVGFVYFAWQKGDVAEIDGREKILAGKSFEGVNLLKKLENAHEGRYEVTFTEKELNYYIAHKLKMTQDGWMKGFSKIIGVYVDLKPDVIEIYIEREFAQYGEDGTPRTEYLQPFNQTVSMKLKIYTVENENDRGTRNIVEFPGGTIGKAPAPGMFVKVVKPSFDQLLEAFKEEVKLGYDEIVSIKIDDGKIILNPVKRYKKMTP